MKELINWRKFKLEEISQIIAGQSPNSDTYNFDKNGLPFYQGKADFGLVSPIPKCWCSEPLKIAEKDDILLSVRAPVGPTNIASEKCCIGRGLCAIRVNNDISMLFIYLYFKLFEKKISQMGSGSTFAAITIEDVKNLVILLPPLKEQKRIVKIIETKIKTIENIQISIAEQEVLSDKLLFSFIQKLITNRDWKNFKFGDICIFTGGSQPPKSMFIHRSQKDYIRLVQIQDFRKDDAVVYIPKEEAKRTFKKDNVMIGRYGPPVFQILRGLEGAYNVALMKAEPIDENIIDNDFLFYLLQEKNLQNAVINQSQRSAGQSGVDKKFLEKQKVRIPDIKTQRTIVTKIEEYKQKTIKLQKHIKEQSLYINTLPQTILQQAFNGEL